MYKPPDNNIKEQIFRASSALARGEQSFLQTPLTLIREMVDFTLIEEEFSFVSKDCWLAGGALLRLFATQETNADGKTYDRDFFFSSRQAMVTIFEEMIQNGYSVVNFNFLQRKFIHRTSITEGDLQLQSCTPEEIINDGRVRDILQRNDLVTLELMTPEKVRCQLIAGYTGNDPLEIIDRFDFTLCQLAIDRDSIYAGADTWNDLFERKLCHTGNAVNMQTAWRFYKFLKMGYRPTVQSVLILFKALILTPTFLGR